MGIFQYRNHPLVIAHSSSPMIIAQNILYLDGSKVHPTQQRTIGLFLGICYILSRSAETSIKTWPPD
jgi:hypothetical protein